MINLLKLGKNFNNQTIYKVWRSVENLPARVLYQKFTNCHFTKYSLKGPDEYGMIEFECEIRGTDKYGKNKNVCSCSVRTTNDDDYLNKPIFFLEVNEALKEKERIISDIKEDIEEFNEHCKISLEESKNVEIV